MEGGGRPWTMKRAIAALSVFYVEMINRENNQLIDWKDENNHNGCNDWSDVFFFFTNDWSFGPKMSENTEKYPSQFLQAWGDVFKFYLQHPKQSKTQNICIKVMENPETQKCKWNARTS